MSARERASRLVAGFAIPTLIGASFVGATALRPRINLAHDGHGSFQLGYQALQEGRPADAVKSYRETVATDPSDPRAWHNLGVAYAQVGDAEQATAAFRRSFELDGSRDRRRTYVEHALRIGQESLQRADTARAEAIGLEILRVEPDERRAQELLVGVYHQTGRTAEEQRMMNRIASHGADAGAL
jgi:Flp pilus assembly protein TadD